MTTYYNHSSRFYKNLWLTLVIFVVFAMVFAMYVRAEKQIDRANETRLQSFLLADELRQSSDDLTRMAFSYVTTGDPIYKQHFQEILDIRDGKKSRPVNYYDIYWDMVLADDKRPRPDSGQTIALLELMRQAGFTDQELAKMAEAKANSDALTSTEFAAMALFESTKPSAAGVNLVKASQMLNNAAYHKAKASMMRPISDFYEMMDRRSLDAVHAAKNKATLLRVMFILFGLLLAIMLERSYRALLAILGSSVDALQKHIALLGNGNFAHPIPVAKGMENSVMAWLSETQSKLARLDAEHKQYEAKNQRLTQLYAALSQCNQAIVRCVNQEELFPQICRDAVTFGGIKMAWIGLLDEPGRNIRPVAFYGSGTEYLDEIHTSINENEPAALSSQAGANSRLHTVQ